MVAIWLPFIPSQTLTRPFGRANTPEDGSSSRFSPRRSARSKAQSDLGVKDVYSRNRYLCILGCPIILANIIISVISAKVNKHLESIVFISAKDSVFNMYWVYWFVLTRTSTPPLPRQQLTGFLELFLGIPLAWNHRALISDETPHGMGVFNDCSKQTASICATKKWDVVNMNVWFD